MPQVKVDRRNLGNVLKAHFKARQDELKAAALTTCHRGVAEGVRLTDAAGLVDQGAYKRGWHVTADPAVTNDSPIAGVIEHGRRPMRPGPPLQPILEWARRKGIPEGAAWAIREAIHRRGLRPHFLMRKVYERMKAWFREEVEKRLRS